MSTNQKKEDSLFIFGACIALAVICVIADISIQYLDKDFIYMFSRF